MKRIASGQGKLEGAEYPVNCEFTLFKVDDGKMELYCKFSLVDQKHIPYTKKFSNTFGDPFKRFEGKSLDGKSISIENLKIKGSNSSDRIQRMWFLANKINL